MAMVAVVILCLQPSWGIVWSRWGSREKVDPYYYTLVFSWPEAVLSPLSTRSHIPYPPQADPFNAYPESLWPSRRWRVSRPSRPCPLCHSPRALGDRRPVPRSPLEGLGWGQGGRAGGSPCSERESRSPCFRNHWPSTLPVTEKAQQEPHMPYKRQSQAGSLPNRRAILASLPHF